jgi:hypothetical protein
MVISQNILVMTVRRVAFHGSYMTAASTYLCRRVRQGVSALDGGLCAVPHSHDSHC